MKYSKIFLIIFILITLVAITAVGVFAEGEYEATQVETDEIAEEIEADEADVEVEPVDFTPFSDVVNRDDLEHRVVPQYFFGDGVGRAPQEVRHSFSVNPASGNLTARVTDLSLPGRNGLDLNLTRVYNSSQSNLFEPYVGRTTVLVPVRYYMLVGVMDIRRMNVFHVVLENRTDVPVGINPNFLPYLGPPDMVTRDLMLGRVLNRNHSNPLNRFEFFNLNENTTPVSNLFTNQADAILVRDRLNTTSPLLNHGVEVELWGDLGYGHIRIDYRNMRIVPVYRLEWRDVHTSTAMSRYTVNERFSRLGAGWSFDFPFVEIRHGADGRFEFLHFGERGTWEIDTNRTRGGENNLVGHPLNDIRMERGNFSLSNRNVSATFRVTEQNGTQYFFGEHGGLLRIQDRFGNQINFFHDTHYFRDSRNRSRPYPVLQRIVDSVGREIVFTERRAGNNTTLTATITDPANSANTRTIVYTKEWIQRNQIGGEENNKYVLHSVTLPNGYTTTYDYEFNPAPANFFYKNENFFHARQNNRLQNAGNSYFTLSDINAGRIDGVNNYFALLTSVTEENGRNAEISYAPFLRNLGNGSMVFYKAYWISEDTRWDDRGQDYAVNGRRFLFEYNNVGAYDGFPAQSRTGFINPNFRVTTRVENRTRRDGGELISTEIYTYRYAGRGDDQTILLESVSHRGADHRIDTLYAYFTGTNLVQRVATRHFVTPTSANFLETTEEFTYDTGNRGNVLTHTRNGSANHRVTFTHHPTFNYITSREFRRDAETVIREQFIPNASRPQVVEWAFVFENDVLQRRTQFLHDSFGNIIEMREFLDTPPAPHTQSSDNFIRTQFSYAANGADIDTITVFDVRDADGVSTNISTSFVHNHFGEIIAVTDERGNTTNIERDELGRITSEIRPQGIYAARPTREWWHITSDSVVDFTDENGNRFVSEFDTSGNLIGLYAGFGGRWGTQLRSFRHNSMNLPTRIMQYSNYGNDTTIIFDYDSLMRPTFMEVQNYRDAVIYREEYAYQIVQQTINGVSGLFFRETVTITSGGDPNSPAIVRSTYTDRFGNVVKVRAGNYYETFQHNFLGEVTETRSARANAEGWTNPTTRVVYNFAGQPIRAYNYLNQVVVMEYDALGRLTRQYDIAGNLASPRYATTFEYDNLGRVIEQRIPFERRVDGSIAYSIRKICYDASGNVIRERTADNAVESTTITFSEVLHTYDVLHRLVKTELNDGNQSYFTQMFYDPNGNLRRVYTGLTAPLVITGLDAFTNPQNSVFAVTRYNYDHMNRVIQIVDALGEAETMRYDLNGNVTSATDRNGNSFRYQHDALGRITEVATMVNGQPIAVTTTNYHRNGQIAWSENEHGRVTYAYDNLGRLIGVTNEAQNSEIVYEYNANGSRTTFTLYVNEVVQFATTYEYDRLNRLWRVLENGVLQATYLYDINGFLSSSATANGLTTTYTHNLAGLLVTQTTGDLLVESFTHYVSGNQRTRTLNGVTTTYSYDRMNRLTAENDTVFTFDSFNNIQTKTTPESVTEFDYDLNNRLRERVVTAGDTRKITQFFYDPNGNLISQASHTIVPRVGSAEPEFEILTTTNNMLAFFSYNSYNQLVEVDMNGVVSRNYFDASGFRFRKTVDDGNEIVTIGMIFDGMNIVAETDEDGYVTHRWLRGFGIIRNLDLNVSYVYNSRGDVALLVNASGEVVWNYTFDAYGRVIGGDSSVYNPFGYRGEWTDSATGFVYLRARFYNPEIMRFMNEDPIRWGFNWFIYADNNPIMFIDPTGLIPQTRYVRASGGLHLRSSPGGTSAIGGQLIPYGAQVTVWWVGAGDRPQASGYSWVVVWWRDSDGIQRRGYVADYYLRRAQVNPANIDRPEPRQLSPLMSALSVSYASIYNALDRGLTPRDVVFLFGMLEPEMGLTYVEDAFAIWHVARSTGWDWDIAQDTFRRAGLDRNLIMGIDLNFSGSGHNMTAGNMAWEHLRLQMAERMQFLRMFAPKGFDGDINSFINALDRERRAIFRD